MKKVVKFLLAVILLVPFCVDAKEIKINSSLHSASEGWGDYFKNVFEVEDGYIAISDSFSDEIFDLPSLGKNDIRIFKYKKGTLEVEWQRIYGGFDVDSVYGAVQTDDGFVIIGEFYSTDIDGLENNGYFDAMIVKFDNSGNVIQQNNWGGVEWDSFTSIKSTSDGGFVVVGYSYLDGVDGLEMIGDYDAIIVKYDKNLNVEWQKNFGGIDYDRFDDVVITDDGYIAIGNTYSDEIEGIESSNSLNTIVVKYDLNGNVVWKKGFGGNSKNYIKCLALDDGSFVVVGESSSFDALIIKFDSFGNILWEKDWGGSEVDGFSNVKLINNTLFILGETYSEDLDGIVIQGRSDAIVVRFDLDGNFISQHSWGGNSWEGFNDIIRTDTGYVLVGSSGSSDLEDLYYDGGYEGALIIEYMITYDLQKEIEEVENGTYDIKQVGQRAEIIINPDNGYELDKIIVKDALGNEVSYYEENGKYYVNLINDIVVDVKYKQKSILNPNTGGLFMVLEIIVLFIIFSYSFVRFKKKKNAI